MTRDELKRLFPKMSESSLALNATDAPPSPKPKRRRSLKEIVLEETTLNGINQDHCLPQSPKPKRSLCDEPFQAPSGKTLYPGRVLVRFTCYRCRLLDTDNVIIKWFLDAARYSMLIRDDRPEDIELQVSQKKVETKAEERTEIELIPIRENQA